MSTITNKQQSNITKAGVTELTTNELAQVTGGDNNPYYRILPGDEYIVVPAL